MSKLISKKTNFKDFFNENEVGSYKDLDDLGNKIEKLKSKPNLINKYGKAGRDKYFKLFNTKKISWSNWSNNGGIFYSYLSRQYQSVCKSP